MQTGTRSCGYFIRFKAKLSRRSRKANTLCERLMRLRIIPDRFVKTHSNSFKLDKSKGYLKLFFNCSRFVKISFELMLYSLLPQIHAQNICIFYLSFREAHSQANKSPVYTLSNLRTSSYEPGSRAGSVRGTKFAFCSYGKFQPG